MSKDIGTLFKPDMVRALLREVNPKRQTRRLHRLGQVGDVLWCREAWRTHRIYDNFPPREVPPEAPVHFEAGGSPIVSGEDGGFFGKLRPSMFMCRWMSRASFILTEVDEEPLNLITEADAIAEGAEPSGVGDDLAHLRYRAGFMALWERINGAGSWEKNPTVIRHVFERIK